MWTPITIHLLPQFSLRKPQVWWTACCCCVCVVVLKLCSRLWCVLTWLLLALFWFATAMEDTSPLLPWWSRIWFDVQRWTRRRCSGNDGGDVGSSIVVVATWRWTIDGDGSVEMMRGCVAERLDAMQICVTVMLVLRSRFHCCNCSGVMVRSRCFHGGALMVFWTLLLLQAWWWWFSCCKFELRAACSWWLDGVWCYGGCALQRRWRSGGCRQWWNVNCHGWCSRKLRGGCDFFLNIEFMASVSLQPRQKRDLWLRVMTEAKRRCLLVFWPRFNVPRFLDRGRISKITGAKRGTALMIYSSIELKPRNM